MNYNKHLLGGRLTKDPELRTTPSGVSVCSFSIAVNQYVAKGEEPKTDFFDCVAWRGTAETVARFFKKGSNIFLEGSTHKKYWTDKEGKYRCDIEVAVDRIEFVDSKQSESPRIETPTIEAQVTAPNFEDITDDDDLPF